MRGVFSHIRKILVLFMLRFNLDLKIKKFAFVLITPNLLLGLIVVGWIIKTNIYSEETFLNESSAIVIPYKVYIDEVDNSNRTNQLKHYSKIDKLIVNYSEKYEVEPSLIRAIIKVESNFDPKATSSKGACGIMQLNEVTQKELGLENPLILEHNIEAGIRYFKTLLDMYDNDLECALAAYNAGPTKVRQYGGVPPYRETKRHIKKVMRYYQQYKKLETEKVEIVQNIWWIINNTSVRL